jgi:hypothetical protein
MISSAIDSLIRMSIQGAARGIHAMSPSEEK